MHPFQHQELLFTRLKNRAYGMTGPVRSVSQAFAILRLLAGDGALTLTQICRATGLSPSSGFNLLRTLMAEGALERAGDARRYRLTPAWQGAPLRSGARLARLIARIQPLITRFAKAHDATCGLWQQLGTDRLALVALGESEAATRIHMAIGQRQPVGAGSVGRALIGADAADQAALPDLADLKRRFARLRWCRPLDFAAWVEQVARARRAGFGVDDGFAHPGVVSIGLVVPGMHNPRLCLSASVFAGARCEPEVEALGRALLELAGQAAFQEP
jgi:DNA-binding IclR family transcriptional regulator